MLFLPVSIIAFIFAGLMCIHIVKTWNEQGKDGFKKFNELMFPTLTTLFGILYPFFILRLGADYKGVVLDTAVEELTFMGNVGIVGATIGLLCWAMSAKIRTIKHPELLENESNYEVWCQKFLENYPERSKIKRRVTHILPVGVVGGCIFIFSFFQFFLGQAWINYALFFCIIIGVDFAITFMIGDLIRLLDYSFMPPLAADLFESGLVPDELNSFSSTSVMVFGFAPLVLFSFPIFFIALLITAVADAMAAIFGILAAQAERKHPFPSGAEKSLEGYFGGVMFTFICTLFGVAFSNFFGLSNWSWQLAVMLGVILSILFFTIDIVTTKVELQDNYVNPLAMGFVTILVLLTANIPIF